METFLGLQTFTEELVPTLEGEATIVPALIGVPGFFSPGSLPPCPKGVGLWSIASKVFMTIVKSDFVDFSATPFDSTGAITQTYAVASGASPLHKLPVVDPKALHPDFPYEGVGSDDTRRYFDVDGSSAYACVLTSQDIFDKFVSWHVRFLLPHEDGRGYVSRSITCASKNLPGSIAMINPGAELSSWWFRLQ